MTYMQGGPLKVLQCYGQQFDCDNQALSSVAADLLNYAVDNNFKRWKT